MAAGSLRRRALILAPVMFVATLRGVAAPPPAADKTVIVGVLDAAGLPVTDLTMADVRLREDGVDREIVSVKLVVAAAAGGAAGGHHAVGRAANPRRPRLARRFRPAGSEDQPRHC